MKNIILIFTFFTTIIIYQFLQSQAHASTKLYCSTNDYKDVLKFDDDKRFYSNYQRFCLADSLINRYNQAWLGRMITPTPDELKWFYSEWRSSSFNMKYVKKLRKNELFLRGMISHSINKKIIPSLENVKRTILMEMPKAIEMKNWSIFLKYQRDSKLIEKWEILEDMKVIDEFKFESKESWQFYELSFENPFWERQVIDHVIKKALIDF